MKHPTTVLVLALAALSDRAGAYELFGRFDRASIPVPYTVDTDRLPFGLAAVQESAARWSGRPEFAFAFHFAGVGPGSTRWDRNHTVRMDRGQMGRWVLGLTYRWTQGSALSAFDVELNGSTQWTRAQFLNTTVHELGHALGLDHSRDTRAIMKPYADGRIVDLAPDDIAGAARLYPPAGGAPPPTGPTAGAPTITAPLGPSPAQPVFRWTAAAGALSYDLAVDRAEGGGRQVKVLRFERLTRTEQAAGQALPMGSYLAFVRAVTAAGPGAWSWAAFQVTERPVTPAAPRVIGPSGRIAQDRPTFRWEPVAGAERYELAIDRLVDGRPVKLHRLEVTATEHPAGGAFAPGSYRWFVRAVNGAGPGPWGWAELEVTSAGPAPVALAAPRLVSPLGDTLEARPTFAWRPVAGATAYELRVEGAAGVVLEERDLASSSRAPGADLAPGAYRWFVRARAGDAAGPWEGAAFDVMTSLGAARVLSPLGQVPEVRPQLSWTAVQGATHYEVLVRRQGEPGALPVLHARRHADTRLVPSWDFTPGVGYELWVRALAGDVAGPWSDAGFDVTPSLTSGPRALFPVGDVVQPRIEFRWTPVDGATLYELQVVDARDGRRLLHEATTDARLVPAGAIAPGYAYRWRVRAFLGDRASPWDVATFTYEAPIAHSLAPEGPGFIERLRPLR